MKAKIVALLLIFINFANAQSNLEKVLRSGEVIITGLSFLKAAKTEAKPNDVKFIESLCIKNKLSDKITFSIVGKDQDDNVVKKELVIQKDGKECVFELPKGIYTYEIVLANKEVFKKGEYKFDEQLTITVKLE
ncbi:hypothetical protein [Flavobacterium sp.]|uniref:hypothetical protein n=1 Tax=Flavobacterium sp. TaxID=239 RepID=UPI003752EC52